EKLKLLATDTQITARTVLDAVSDNARYSVFELADKALQGDAAGSLHMLHGLRGEGTEPAVVLWSLAREIRTLHEMQLDCASGQSVMQALNARRVWKNRVSMMQGALARHDQQSMARLLELASKVDGSIKGFAGGRPWDNLEDLVLGICRI
ncbi:MAG: DNA polymerase III subunit delta, partial [Halieaceae bacterium]|nr:DNA polymerase III subunit delta [Halieaceae bacterium]